MLSDEDFQKLVDAGLPPDTPRTTHGDYWNEVVKAVQYFWEDATARRFLVDGQLVSGGTPWPRRYWKKTAGSLTVPTYLLELFG